jgi:hypothetical protein
MKRILMAICAIFMCIGSVLADPCNSFVFDDFSDATSRLTKNQVVFVLKAAMNCRIKYDDKGQVMKSEDSNWDIDLPAKEMPEMLWDIGDDAERVFNSIISDTTKITGDENTQVTVTIPEEDLDAWDNIIPTLAVALLPPYWKKPGSWKGIWSRWSIKHPLTLTGKVYSAKADLKFLKKQYIKAFKESAYNKLVEANGGGIAHKAYYKITSTFTARRQGRQIIDYLIGDFGLVHSKIKISLMDNRNGTHTILIERISIAEAPFIL